METVKNVYRYKSVYYVIFLFSFLVVIFYGFGLIRNINTFSTYSFFNCLFLTQTIFNLIIFITSVIYLFSKYKKSIFINNIGYISLVIVIIQNIFMFLFTKYKVSNSLTLAFVILGVVLTVMFLNNYFKVNNEYNEIEEIGNINNKV